MHTNLKNPARTGEQSVKCLLVYCFGQHKWSHLLPLKIVFRKKEVHVPRGMPRAMKSQPNSQHPHCNQVPSGTKQCGSAQDWDGRQITGPHLWTLPRAIAMECALPSGHVPQHSNGTVELNKNSHKHESPSTPQCNFWVWSWACMVLCAQGCSKVVPYFIPRFCDVLSKGEVGLSVICQWPWVQLMGCVDMLTLPTHAFPSVLVLLQRLSNSPWHRWTSQSIGITQGLITCLICWCSTEQLLCQPLLRAKEQLGSAVPLPVLPVMPHPHSHCRPLSKFCLSRKAGRLAQDATPQIQQIRSNRRVMLRMRTQRPGSAHFPDSIWDWQNEARCFWRCREYGAVTSEEELVNICHCSMAILHLKKSHTVNRR